MDGAAVDLTIGRSAESGCDEGSVRCAMEQDPEGSPRARRAGPSTCAWAGCDDATPLAGHCQEGRTMLVEDVHRIESTLLDADRRRSWHRPVS